MADATRSSEMAAAELPGGGASPLLFGDASLEGAGLACDVGNAAGSVGAEGAGLTAGSSVQDKALPGPVVFSDPAGEGSTSKSSSSEDSRYRRSSGRHRESSRRRSSRRRHRSRARLDRRRTPRSRSSSRSRRSFSRSDRRLHGGSRHSSTLQESRRGSPAAVRPERAASSSSQTRRQELQPLPTAPVPAEPLPIQAGSQHDGGPVVVWLIGHSFLYWAEKRAEVRPGGRHFGLEGVDVRWRGSRGLRWRQVLPDIVAASRLTPGPAVVIVHAGGNDLGHVKLAELITMIRQDLRRVYDFFGQVVLVWSEIVPRICWRGARDLTAIERARRVLNIRVSKFVKSLGGVTVRHLELEGENEKLLLKDGVHLNAIGTDIFLSGIRDGLERALVLLGGGANRQV
ncbi:uncharacterized protein RB166_014636 [Leptodactylus fuscus]|uniref:uncharacterized protein LOC142185490 n=1 Tax=Leptodactylus fuscus TaxID=238119 RepID=UPI003F4F06AF